MGSEPRAAPILASGKPTIVDSGARGAPQHPPFDQCRPRGFLVSRLVTLEDRLRVFPAAETGDASSRRTPSSPGHDTDQRDWSRYNEGERFPTFSSLDLRLDRRTSVWSLQLEVHVDVQNAHNRNNMSAARWDPPTNEPEYNESIDVLPALGINIEFRPGR